MLTSLLLTAITAATPLLLAALGELVSERAGVLNLSLEGMMLCGAVAAFAITTLTGSQVLGILAGATAGIGLSAVFAVLVVGLASDQVASGLALTIFGTGLSSLIGASFTGRTVATLPRLAVPGLSDMPVAGPLVFGEDALVYASIGLTVAIAWFLGYSRAGLVLRAVGEADGVAHALGHDVRLTRVLAILFGGAMSGLGGAYLPLAYTPLWAENMVAGRGWIALAIVVFAAWRPWRVLAGAYLFGGIAVLQLFLQGSGLVHIPAQLFSMAPYLATILVLVIISSGRFRGALAAPGCLGKSFIPVR